MKRVALVIDSLAGGGAEKIVLTLALQLHRLGHDPHLLVLEPHCAYKIPTELKVHYCFGPNPVQIGSIWKLASSVSKAQKWISAIESQYGKFDIFLSNLDKSNLLMTRAGVNPLFCVVHNSIEEELKRQLKLGPFAYFGMLKAKRALNGQRIITVSRGIEKEIRSEKRISPLSIHTIYNPFDLEEIRKQSNEHNDDIPKEDFIIHVGRVAKQKRHDQLFSALAQMKQPMTLVLLCNNRKKALKIAAKYGVADRVYCPGFQANPFAWIKAARLLVLSSDYEGLPTVLIESLACATPVVSTRCPHGPDEILTGALDDFLVPRRDPKALAAKMDQALTSYPDLSHIDILDAVQINKVTQAYLKLLD